MLEHAAKSTQDFLGHLGLQNELQHSIGRELRAPLRRDETRELLGIDGGILTEFEGHRIALAFDGVHADAQAKKFERGVVEQVANRLRRLAVAVRELGADIGELRFGLDSGDPLVHSQPLIFLRNVFRGNTDI